MKFSKKLMFCFLMLTVFSCSTQRFIFDNKRANSVSEPSFTKWGHFIFWGVGQRSSFDPKEMCKEQGENLAQVEFVQTFPNIVLTVITFGIYSPREARIYCAK